MSATAAKRVGRTVLKRNIRSAERLLSREDLPEDVRVAKERVLQLLRDELGKSYDDARTKKVAKKYKMVKFFERRKVSRMLKTKLRDLSTTCDLIERTELLASINQLRKRFNYIMNYPPDVKYIALYPSHENTSAKALRMRENLMKKINKKVASGELCDASLEITGSHLADHLLPTADLRHAIGEAESDDPVMRKNHMEVEAQSVEPDQPKFRREMKEDPFFETC